MVKATSSVFIAAILAAPALGAGLDNLYERETVEQDIYGRNLVSTGVKLAKHHHHHVEAAAEVLNSREYQDLYVRHYPPGEYPSSQDHHHHHVHNGPVAAPVDSSASPQRREYMDIYRRNHEHPHHPHHFHRHPQPPPTPEDGSLRRREFENHYGLHHDSPGVPPAGVHHGPFGSHPTDPYQQSMHHEHALGALPGSPYHHTPGSMSNGAHHPYGAMGSGPGSRPTAVQQALERFKSLIQKKQQDRLQMQHPHPHSGALMQRDLDGLLDERDLEDLNEVLAREYDEALYEREFGDEDLFEREFLELEELD